MIWIAIPVLIVLALVVTFAALRRRDTGEAVGSLSRETQKSDRPATVSADDTEQPTGRDVEKAAVLERRQASEELVLAGSSASPAPYVPPDPEQLGATRRQFLNRSIIGMFALGLGAFGAGVIAFLYPSGVSGFGSVLRMGNVTDLIAEIRAGDGFLYRPEGRMWITEYPSGALEKAQQGYSQPELNAMEAGVTALYQKCPHLGCRIPSCLSSQWFECPCHGSQYNQAGEKRGGPAPRGMDHFATSVDNGVLFVDTGAIIQGPPIGTNTTGQEAEGPNCLSGGEGHS
ncbi:MAG: Rieske 2Fe-2S domain-containing protein [Acidimicrobiia bacterium]|nr:Rieske 2Fe-2S domain-containing protein [Acidimicrobiia bacterium]